MNAVTIALLFQLISTLPTRLSRIGGAKKYHRGNRDAGLMAIRAEYAPLQPLRGARVAGSLHMTIQTAVLIETLQALGAEVRWASCNVFSTQDHAAAAIAARGTSVFAHKGETLDEYWDYTHRIFEWPKSRLANLMVDDGGDATGLLHFGARAERDRALLEHPANADEAALFKAIDTTLGRDPHWYSGASAPYEACRRKPPSASSASTGWRRKVNWLFRPSTSTIR